MSQTVHTLLTLASMFLVFIITTRTLKLSPAFGMLFGALCGAIVAGQGIALRHLIEGGFMYFDVVMVIITASIFMRLWSKSGGLNVFVRDLIRWFSWSPSLLLILLMFVMMLPAALTGSGTAAIMAAGSLVATVLEKMGLPKKNIVGFIAMGAVFGLVAPPINIPAMIISTGINMPYDGFFGPLLILSLPLGAAAALLIGRKHIGKSLDTSVLLSTVQGETPRLGSFGAYIPLLSVIVIMILQRAFPRHFPQIGNTMVFVIGSIVAAALSKKLMLIDTIRSTLSDSIGVCCLLIAVGSIVQVMTLTGVRGLLVVTTISAPLTLLFVLLFLGLPLSGCVLGTYGAASVFGIPFMLALLGRNPIIATAGISLIAGLATLTPPTALDGRAAMLVVKYEGSYSEVLKTMAVPAIAADIVGTLFVIFASSLSWLIL